MAEEKKVPQRRGEGWYGDLYGTVPLQGWGRVDGYPWYFRARGSYWGMEIGEDQLFSEEKLPAVGWEIAGWMIEQYYAPWPEAGYMETDVAWGFIEETITAFRAGKLPMVPANVCKRDE
jgi:hypothetical protein